MTRLRSVTTSATVAANTSVAVPMIAPMSAAVGRQLEQRVHARDQVDAGGDHRGGVDQGGDRGGALHRVREPGVERELGRLGERADQDQQAGGHERAVVRPKTSSAPLEHAEVVERAGLRRSSRKAAITRPTSPITLITNALMPA